MKSFRSWVLAGALCVLLLMLPGAVTAQNAVTENQQEIMTLIKEQNNRLNGELRRVQREIAALRADLNKPGLKDVFSGIGYIFGLFGVAAFVASRRRE